MVLPTRIELVIALYQSAGMPFTYRRELAVNIHVKIYENLTPGGLYFHLSLDNGVCYIAVFDIHDVTYFEMKYFTNVNLALRWINNL